MCKKKHNGIISFWKFMFSIMIISVHLIARTKQNSQLSFPGGVIGVEFFFMVSGFSMGKHSERQINNSVGKETLFFLKNRISKLYPYIFISYIISLIYALVFYNLQTYEIINTIWDLLLLRVIAGTMYWHVFEVLWFVSALIISYMILYPLMQRFKDNFFYVIVPLIILFISGYLSNTTLLANHEIWTGLVYTGLLRGILGVSIGSILYKLSKFISGLDFSYIGKVLISFLEIFGFLAVFYLATQPYSNQRYDYIMILILCISISLAFSKKTLLYKFSNNKLFYLFEKLSLPMYLNQIWIIDLVLQFINKNNLNLNYNYLLLIIIIISIVVAILMLPLTKSIVRIKNKLVNLLLIKNYN